ncbi:adhesion G protein-coupled receptor F5 [Heteronotia binoei]|uniref:adhesion G protein-coupled receptor F5 n=1 Tax=Heteronotia binoei TaxID=13085 RepID=UPI00292D7F84|nr:adhesion G protein-coupled receptor F5 [Heteronotia binoei]
MLFWTITSSFCTLLQVAQGSSHELWDGNSGSLVRSPLHGGRRGGEEVTGQRDLHRQKRQAALPEEYTIAVEIRFVDSSLQNAVKSYLKNLSFPLFTNATDPTETISSVHVNTVCNSTGSDSTHCCCEDDYRWLSEICTHPACLGTTAAPEGHNCIAQLPSQEMYCQLLPEEIYTRKMFVRLNIPFQNALKNPSSEMYQQYKRDLERAFTVGYKTLYGFISANVTEFRSGSTVVDYEVTSARAIPVEKASGKVAAALNSSYKLDPTSFRSPSVEIYGGTNISILPRPIFKGDTVTMRCESRANSSNVTWSFQGSSISSSGRHSITSGHSNGKSISTLKIRNILLNESGEYRCTFTEHNTSPMMMHTAEGNINVSLIQLMKSEDVTMVCNGEKRELSCCVDTEMSFFTVHWKSNGAINISGTNYSTLNCTQYVLQANESQCPADKSGTITTYTCEVSTTDGARQSKHIAVKYLRKANVTLMSSTNGRVSEGANFSLRCHSDISNYDHISWEIQNGNPVQDISSLWYTTTKTPNGAESVLDVRRADQNWAGTYTCTFFQESLKSSARQAVEVFPLPLKQDIIRDPIEVVIPCSGNQMLKCCVATGRSENYTVTFHVDQSDPSSPDGQRQEGSFICYVKMLSYDNCGHEKAFFASCTFRNQIGGSVQSSPMNLTLAPKNALTCNSSDVGVGVNGTKIVKPCKGNNSSVRGNITYTCNHIWVIAQNSCLSVTVNNLLLGAESLVLSPAPDKELPAYLGNLNNTVKTEQKDISNSSANLEAVVDILNKISTIPLEAEMEPMANFLSTVDTVISAPTDTWNGVTNGSSQLLDSVEQFSNSLIAINDTIPSVILENIQLQGVVLNESDISDYNKDFTFSSLSNLSSNVLIDKEAIENGKLFQSTIISVAYSNLSHIIPQHEQSQELINGLVISTVVKANQSEPFQIKMTFAKINKSLITPRCVFWNFSFQGDQGYWDNTGCQSEENEGHVSCSCDHLTSFSVLMSPAKCEDYGASKWQSLRYLTYIGLGVSILSLVACIVIEALVWKSVTKTRISYMRHICILNVAISLLIADTWFIVIAAKEQTGNCSKTETKMEKKLGTEICIAAAFFVHFFYLCVFFWMLSLSLLLFYHLVFILHNTSKTTMKAVAFCLGYGCPLVISGITIAVTLPQKSYLRNHTQEDICFLNWDNSYALLALVVPALVIVAINAVITAVVIAKIPRRSIGERSRNDERSSLYRIAKSIGVLTPLLGLTWGFGLAVVFKDSSLVFHILFNFFNAFQGLFILLFGILWDRKVREALLNKFSRSRWSSRTSKSTGQSPSAPMLSLSSPFSRVLNNLFGKAGKYQVSSTESASSSSENTSKAHSLLT